MTLHITPDDQKALETLLASQPDVLKKEMPDVSHDVRNKVEGLTTSSLEKREVPMTYNAGPRQYVEYKTPTPSRVLGKTKGALAYSSAETKPGDKIGGGLIGGVVGAGSMLGLSTLMAAGSAASVDSIVIGGVTIAKTVTAGASIYATLGAAATIAIIPAAALGIYLGAKHLSKWFAKRRARKLNRQ